MFNPSDGNRKQKQGVTEAAKNNTDEDWDKKKEKQREN